MPKITTNHCVLKARRFATCFAAALLLSVVWVSGMASSVSAQSYGWEISCNRKVDSPENGDTMREFLCTRQRDCQSDANRKGAAVYGNGCFGVAPSEKYSR